MEPKSRKTGPVLAPRAASPGSIVQPLGQRIGIADMQPLGLRGRPIEQEKYANEQNLRTDERARVDVAHEPVP